MVHDSGGYPMLTGRHGEIYGQVIILLYQNRDTLQRGPLTLLRRAKIPPDEWRLRLPQHHIFVRTMLCIDSAVRRQSHNLHRALANFSF